MKETDSQVVIYKPPGGSVSLEVKLQGETVWLNLNQMTELFGRDKSVISRHLRNVYDTGELKRSSTVAFFATVHARAKGEGPIADGCKRLLASLECERREGGRPEDEPRHPVAQEGLPWTDVFL
ncbi:MAG TPA: hypothetical protein VEH09_05970, partial [Thermodesulfobacteriota bacterium]|nr:hypothetical protein [Thermodesulfobacteriota bacterium]